VHYVAASALTHEGALREANEDSMVVGPWTTCASVTRTPATMYFPLDEPVLLAVADGLGGHAAGEVASSLVVQHIARAAGTVRDEDGLRSLVDSCNRAVHEEAEREPAYSGMGTTVAGVLVHGQRVLSFNVGDSRVYALDGDELTRFSVDDNPPLAPGQTHSSVLTQTLGGQRQRQSLDTHVSARERGDELRLLVCSDGLSDVVDDETIASILREHHGTQVTYQLWRAAMEAGGPDNITVIVADFGTDEAGASGAS
jgi:serine/threonine protein phosphatase PrpC